MLWWYSALCREVVGKFRRRMPPHWKRQRSFQIICDRRLGGGKRTKGTKNQLILRTYFVFVRIRHFFLKVRYSSRPNVPKIPFIGYYGFSTFISSAEPLDYYFLLANDKLLHLVLQETNIEGYRMSQSAISRIRIRFFKEVTRADLEIFLKIIFLAANIRARSFVHYWERNNLYPNFPIFRNAVSRDRFLDVSSALQFSRVSGLGWNRPIRCTESNHWSTTFTRTL